MHSIHPLAEAYRNLTDGEYQALKKSIKKHGQQHPIHVAGELILDGRHRYRACRELGIAPIFEEYAGDDLEAFINALNDARRHETAEERQKRMDAAAAKVTTKNGRPAKTVSPDTVSKFTNDDAAKEAGVSRATHYRRKAKLAQKEKVSSNDFVGAYVAESRIPTVDEVHADTGLSRRASRDVVRNVKNVVAHVVEPMEKTPLEIQQQIEARAAVIAAQNMETERTQMYEFITKDVQEKVRYADRYRMHDNAAPLTDKEFKTLLFALHPDQTSEARRAEALTIIHAHKEHLTVEGAFRKAPPPLPTFEDYLAAKKQSKAKKEMVA